MNALCLKLPELGQLLSKVYQGLFITLLPMDIQKVENVESDPGLFSRRYVFRQKSLHYFYI